MSSKHLKVAVIGATGYTGLELVRILCRHPNAKITAVTSEQYAGQTYCSVYPSATGLFDMPLEPLDINKIAQKADLIFTAVPHREAMRIVPSLLQSGRKVVDLSADFRFSNQATYEAWYQPHSCPELLSKAVYGLPELKRRSVKQAHLVANPGCYPTSIILPLAPLLKDGLVSTARIIADSKSGVSGAGRSAKTASLYCEVAEGFKAYSLQAHRHQPEIEEQLSSIAGRDVNIVFSPHLLPMNRGMLSTVYVELKSRLTENAVGKVFEHAYRREPFVRVLPPGTLPQTGWVRGTNFCDIGFSLSDKSLVIVSCIDNLVKGASGQAVQNMNIMMGFQETAGLDAAPLYP